MFKLKVVESSISVPDMELQTGLNTVGRVPPNSCQIPDPSISARHCTILLSDQTMVVEDMGSTNGTLVDNVSVYKAPLKPGQRLRLGTVLVDVVAEATAAVPVAVQVTAAVPPPIPVRLPEPALNPAVRQAFPAGRIAIPHVVITQPAVAATVPASNSVMRVTAVTAVATTGAPGPTPVMTMTAPPEPAEPVVRVASYLLTPKPTAEETAQRLAQVTAAAAPPVVPVVDGCKKHVDRTASLICLQCQNLFCLECSPPRTIGSKTRHYCPACNVQCRNLIDYRNRQAALAARAKLTFWQRTLGKFKHPFGRAALWLVGSSSTFYLIFADV